MREGGHNYEALVRKTIPRKPIRVFLQDGENDLDNANGNWPLANQTLAKSLAYAGYDYKFEYGHGFHSNRHGRAILPDSLRWLWRDYKPMIQVGIRCPGSVVRDPIKKTVEPSLRSRSASADRPVRPQSSWLPA